MSDEYIEMVKKNFRLIWFKLEIKEEGLLLLLLYLLLIVLSTLNIY